jgi:hypothetical protein
VPADTFSIATPAGSYGVAKDRREGKADRTRHEGFFCLKPLDKEKVLSAMVKR